MTTNLYFSPIRAHFKPLPEFTISPQSLVKKIVSFIDDKASPSTTSAAITPLKFSALVSSYLLSPNLMIPLQLLEVLAVASSSSTSGVEKVINTIFSAAVLGVICKYTHDGTLRKFSNDLYSLSNEAENALIRLKKKDDHKEVTFYEPIQIPENPQQLGCIRSIISFINSIFRKIFQFLFSIKESAQSSTN